jgi:hypothetical protein
MTDWLLNEAVFPLAPENPSLLEREGVLSIASLSPEERAALALVASDTHKRALQIARSPESRAPSRRRAFQRARHARAVFHECLRWPIASFQP